MTSRAQEAYLGRLRVQLTEARLTPYLKKSGGDVPGALARYYWNIQLCEAFYPLLQELEIVFRNNLDRAFAAAHPTARCRHIKSWLDSTPVVVIHKNGQEDIARAKSRLRGWDREKGVFRPGFCPQHDDLVAALSFGFWTGLLAGVYDRSTADRTMAWPYQKAAFPGASGESTTSIRITLNGLRHLRNRIFHHEPIWQKRGGDPTPAQWYDTILRALRWLGGEQSQVASRMHQVGDLFDEATQIPSTRQRLLDTVNEILEVSRKRNAEKEVPAARHASP